VFECNTALFSKTSRDRADDAHANLMQFNGLSAKTLAAMAKAALDNRKALDPGKFLVNFHCRNNYFSFPAIDSVMAANQLLRVVKMEICRALARRFEAHVTRT
jgi:hypothetical protein